jgi:Carboxypeptidase regulatory-like domain/TonB dependent receptor/TonB-dependent Receptor Plug Domain
MNRTTYVLRVFSRLFAIGICAAALMFAQSDTAVLFGVVTDQSGSTVRSAKVLAHNAATGAIREYSTDERGLFYFTLLPPGQYTVTVEAAGFKQFSDTNIRVQVAQVGRLNIELEIGNTKEVVNIASDTSTLNSESVSEGTVIGSEKIPAMPLNGRQFIQLALLVPGVNSGGRSVQQNAVRQSDIGGISIAGNRTNNTQFLLDGVSNIDPDYNSLNYSPNVDAIAEFQVQTAMVGAEYGRAGINIVTRSGGNDHHGSAWEFLRNNDFDARPFNLLQSSVPKFQRNQYGAAYGGPILKNKLFDFVTFEGLKVRQAGAGLTSVAVPNANQRAGNFNGTSKIFDPDSAVVGGSRSPFPNFTIPASRINPLALAAINAIPLPTDTTRNLYQNANGILTQDNDNTSGRVDYVVKQNWTLFGRYSIQNEDAVIPNLVPGRASEDSVRAQHASIGSTYVINTNLVNETRLGFSRMAYVNGLPEITFQVNGQPTKLPQFILSPYPTMGGAGGYAATTGGGIVQVRDNSFQFYDNVSWRHGRHAIKFGGDIYHVQYNRIEVANLLGTYTFTNGFTTQTLKSDGTGDSLASLMLALPQISSRSVGPSRIDGRQWEYSLYFQDDFKLTPTITLNLGLRYELAPPMYDAHQQMSSIDYSKVPSAQSIFQTGPLATYQPTLFVCGQSGYPKGCAYTDKNNFAPRVGVAWAVTPKTVFRAGGGIFYDLTDLNPLFRLAAGLPDNIAQTLTSNNFTPQYRGFDVFGPNVVGPSQLQGAGIDLNERTSYSMQWNANLQRELAKDLVVEAGYIGTMGLKLEQNVQPNNAPPGTAAIDPRRPYLGVQYAPNTVFPPYITVIGNSVPMGFINFLPHSAQSNYHAFVFRLEKRYTNGFSILNAYTFSKAITNAPQFRNAGGVNGNENSPPQDSYNLRTERGLAYYNVGQRWTTTALYELPFGPKKHYLTQGIASHVLGDWQVSGIFSMQTGFPFTINISGDTAGVGAGTGGIYVRPNAIPGQTYKLPGDQQSTNEYFNIAAFSQPAAGAFGNVGKNTVIGPPLTNLDLVVSRMIAIRERFKLEFRGEAFNVANHSNYLLVGRIINTPATFGKVLSQLDPRQIQLGLKLIF